MSSISVSRRVEGIDALRAVAIFAVLMNHVNMRLYLAKVPYTTGLPDQLTTSLFWSGQYGVQMFFALSGFLITTTSLRRWESLAQIHLADFYRLRFARIGPLLLLLLLVLSALHFAQLPDFIVSAKTGGLGRALFAALTFHINVLEAQRRYLPANWDVLWSLSVEELFYLAFPLLCMLLARGPLLIAVLVACVIVGPFARTSLAHGNEVWAQYSYLGGMDGIALGCLAALLNRRTRYSPQVLRMLAVCGSAVVIFIVSLSNLARSLGLSRSGLDMSLLAFATCLIAVAATQSGWRCPRLVAPFILLGERSYEIYLTHMFIVFALFHMFVFSGKALGAVPFLFVTTIFCAAVLGDLVARYFSEPMNWLLRRQRLGKAVAQTT